VAVNDPNVGWSLSKCGVRICRRQEATCGGYVVNFTEFDASVRKVTCPFGVDGFRMEPADGLVCMLPSGGVFCSRS
jgi:hypothetical protein